MIRERVIGDMMPGPGRRLRTSQDTSVVKTSYRPDIKTDIIIKPLDEETTTEKKPSRAKTTQTLALNVEADEPTMPLTGRAGEVRLHLNHLLEQSRQRAQITQTVLREISHYLSSLGQLPEHELAQIVKSVLRLDENFSISVDDRFFLQVYAAVLENQQHALQERPSEENAKKLSALCQDIVNELHVLMGGKEHLTDVAQTMLAQTEEIREAKILANRNKQSWIASQKKRQMPLPVRAQVEVPRKIEIVEKPDNRHIPLPGILEDFPREAAPEPRPIRIITAPAEEARQLEREASERNQERMRLLEEDVKKHSAERIAAVRAQDAVRQAREDGDSRPSARAIRLIEARNQAYQSLQTMETAAQQSFFTAVGNSLARERERRRIAQYSKQLEEIYSRNPGVQNEIREMLTEPHLTQFTRAMDRKKEQREFQKRKLEDAEYAARLRAEPNTARIRAIQMEKVLSLTVGERAAKSSMVPETIARDYLHFSQRVTQLRATIEKTKPKFLDRLFRTDPVEAQRKELAYTEQRIQNLIEKYPQLVP